MTKAEVLAYMYKIDGRATKALLDDVTEEESMERGKHNLNHIRWIAGHLVYETNALLQMIGCPPADLPARYKELFDMGSEVSDDPSVYPSIAELRKQLYELNDRLMEGVAKISDEALEEMLPKEIGFEAPRVQAAAFMGMHTFYHAGQLAVMRRILGRERAFK